MHAAIVQSLCGRLGALKRCADPAAFRHSSSLAGKLTPKPNASPRAPCKVNQRSSADSGLLKRVVWGLGLGSVFGAGAMASAQGGGGAGGGSEARLQRGVEGWAVGRTNFHRTEPNSLLVEFEQQLLPREGPPATILVPLCGKSVDLPYLAGKARVGHVVGVEGVPQAVREYVDENPHPALHWAPFGEAEDADPGIFETCSTRRGNPFLGGPAATTDDEQAGGTCGGEPGTSERNTCDAADSPAAGDVSILVGDFFLLPSLPGSEGSVDRVWDRAALIAVRPQMRPRYVDVLHHTMKPGALLLLATLHRAQGSEESKAAGPPFSLPERQVRELFADGRFHVDKVYSKEVIHDYERFQQQGLVSLKEEVYMITKL